MSSVDSYERHILHRKEISKVKPLSPDVQWMLQQCSSEALTSNISLYSPLPCNPDLPPLDKQSYQQWKAMYETQKLSHPRRMRRDTIIIQPLTYSSADYDMFNIEPQILEYLQECCRIYFMGMNVTLAQPLEISDVRTITKRIHKETQREQLLVDDLIKYLKSHCQSKAFCVVGVTIVDLYPGPEWNFTLGHALLTEGVAVCSFGRHFNSRKPSSQSILQQQLSNLWILVRVLTHEIGHVFGLKHCLYFSCAMNETADITEVIKQPLFLCPICLRKVHKVLKFNVLQRYQLLLELCHRLSLATPTSNDELLSIKDPSSCFQAAMEWLQRSIDSFNSL